jgi:hypothetical protein
MSRTVWMSSRSSIRSGSWKAGIDTRFCPSGIRSVPDSGSRLAPCGNSILLLLGFFDTGILLRLLGRERREEDVELLIGWG